MTPTTITEEDYIEAEDSNSGWCTNCKAFTGDYCEPDARNYECPDCEQRTVFGAAEALLEEMITF